MMIDTYEAKHIENTTSLNRINHITMSHKENTDQKQKSAQNM